MRTAPPLRWKNTSAARGCSARASAADRMGPGMTALLDAHLHFEDPAARHQEGLAAHRPLRRRFGPEDLDTGAYELTGAVVVQAGCRGPAALDEVRWITDLTRDNPLIRGVV